MSATSPYLNTAARRASIQCVTLRSPIQAVTSEYQHRFARTRSDGLPLEKTPAIEPLWHSWLAGALTLFAIAVVWMVL